MNCALSQNPLVKIWDKDFGGNGMEIIYSLEETFDGGYLLGGFSIQESVAIKHNLQMEAEITGL